MSVAGLHSSEMLPKPAPTERRPGSAGRLIRALIKSQTALSRAFDHLLPLSFRIDGASDFKQHIVPSHLGPALAIYDIGGGARPCVTLEVKQRLGLTVAGIDIGADEFTRAPPGVYDRTIVADITAYRESEVADLVICKSTLEHVHNTEAALAAMASLLRPGGTLLVFTPSRNAMFARLNRLLPERFKRRLLSFFMPDKADHLGFPAFYDRCTPRNFRRFAAQAGLDVVELRAYYTSTYFSVAFPVYVLWRLWIIASRLVAGEDAAETFVLVARKPESGKGSSVTG